MKLLKINIRGKWMSLGRVNGAEDTGNRIVKVLSIGYVGKEPIPADFKVVPSNFKLFKL